MTPCGGLFFARKDVAQDGDVMCSYHEVRYKYNVLMAPEQSSLSEIMITCGTIAGKAMQRLSLIDRRFTAAMDVMPITGRERPTRRSSRERKGQSDSADVLHHQTR